MPDLTIPHDKPDQLARIQAELLPGEELYAVYDAKGLGTGFIGLTSLRAIIRDDSYVGGRKTMVSVPYGSIQSVGNASDASVFGSFVASSSVAFATSGRTYSMNFRTTEKGGHAYRIILNKILRR